MLTLLCRRVSNQKQKFHFKNIIIFSGAMLNIKILCYCIYLYFVLLYIRLFNSKVNLVLLHFLRIMNASKIYICKDYSDTCTNTNIEKFC